MKRRDFITKSTLAAGLLSLGRIPETFAEFGQTPSSTKQNDDTPGLIPKRPYGKTGVMLSVIGFGGIVVMNAEQEDADRAVAQAYERGVNYYDVAPSYGDAEIKLGPALKPYRKKVFLSCINCTRLRTSKTMSMRFLPTMAQ